MECLLPYLCMVTVPHIMVGLERMLDYRGVGLARFHCTTVQLECEFIAYNIAGHLLLMYFQYTVYNGYITSFDLENNNLANGDGVVLVVCQEEKITSEECWFHATTGNRNTVQI